MDTVYAGLVSPLLDEQEKIEMLEQKLIRPLSIDKGMSTYLLQRFH